MAKDIPVPMLNTEEVEYIEFPARTIGGGTGNYELQCDVLSCQWAEYMVVSLTNGAVAGQGAAIVNGNSRASVPAGLDYTATAGKSLNNDNSIKGTAYVLNDYIQTFTPVPQWERITNSEKRVFVRIDAQAACSMYVSLKFRVAVLKIIPMLPASVQPDDGRSVNEARAAAVLQRLQLEREIARGEEKNTAKHLRYGVQGHLLKGHHAWLEWLGIDTIEGGN